MLTLIEALSIAGDRGKQNDDACGAAGAFAWVIDGATDLHEPPIAPAASDAAWLAHRLNAFLHRAARDLPATEDALRGALREASADARLAFSRFPQAAHADPWASPLASALIVAEADGGVIGLDLGDCRAFALDAHGAAFMRGGPDGASDREAAFAASFAHKDPPASGALYRTPDALAALRKARIQQIESARPGVFCLSPACADHARAWRLGLTRGAHILLCTDGLSALVDRYDAYDAGGVVRAALEKGLQELARELRAIESEDAGGARHPRFKRCDDATGLLLRLD
ncbi:MAG: protein phosphatase 2C domain-containing protein [Hydrogenophilaceae bacterium]|jgi:hypothetical protein|nr:protein phosphatase 2C domain-containing protein [Hydrogenophilaceae bacterium]